MKGKGKAKLKSPAKHPAKASVKEGRQLVTITDMFKKQNDRISRSSSVVVNDDDDVIIVEENTFLPNVEKTLPNSTKESVKISKDSMPTVAASQSFRKRKLSLVKPGHMLNSDSSCPSENSKTKSYRDKRKKDDIKTTDDIFVKESTSAKLTKAGKLDINTEATPKIKITKQNYHKKHVCSEKNNIESPSRHCENLDSNVLKPSYDSSLQFTGDIKSNSANEMDVVFYYSPIFSPQGGSIEVPPTLNYSSTLGKNSGEWQKDSETFTLYSHVHSDKRASKHYDSKETDCDVMNGEDNSTSKKDTNSDVMNGENNSASKKDTDCDVMNGEDNSTSKKETDCDVIIGEDNSTSETHFKVPYYLNNFETLLHSVMEDETNKKLFNEEDLHIITVFQNLSDGAKKLYIRMFTRKLHWIPLSKLKYPEIGEDLNPYLQELATAAFIDCDEQLTDLEEVLKALTAADIKTLAKSYHITSSISQKGQLMPELLKISQQSTLTTMFGSIGGGVAKTMLSRAKKFLSGIYRLKQRPRGVFVRAMMLFSLVNTLVDEDNGTGGQGQLFQMLMVNMGKLVFPTYTIEKVHNIFQEREDLIRFESALQLESDLLHCIDRGNWEQAYLVFRSIEKEWNLLTADESIAKWNQRLPSFLRCYTATSVIHRLLCSSVEILQRRKDFIAAVELLRTLLLETLYNCSHRGYLWERLALNLDAHIKQPLESLEAVKNGLADKHVRVGHRYALYLRAESICQRARLKLQHRLEEFHHDVVQKTPQVNIEGRVIHQGVSTNGTRFLTEESYVDGNSQDMTVVGVEEYVLAYYKKNGFPSGIHAEGSIVSTLFALFFWDILFMDMPDAFHSPFQALPLDLHSDMFYDRRKDVIEERLAKLKESSVQELQAEAEETWTNQHGVVCAGMNWDRMSLDCIKELLSCIGGEVLSGLIGRYARCPRHTRSGFPDLTLWNVDTGTLKICEVKGPGDRLSHKQILWIDYLLSLGVDAEVCHVKAVAAKKLKPFQQ